MMRLVQFATLTLVGAVHAVLPNPFDQVKGNASASTNSLQVDLGYEIYQGVTNATVGINTFKGIRFAAAPTGSLRWQAPTVPALNRSSVLEASAFGPACPQTGSGGKTTQAIPGSSEDCLFLSVYAPRNASKLAVMVWVHGGGYGQGSGTDDMTDFVYNKENGLIAVSIQYRLGAFGFLASDEVHRNGVVNAGLLDQHFALQWVQAYIEKFGGDPRRVTIAGESAGGGAVMLQDISYGGSLGTSLFTNTISASPFLPQQYGYKDWIPSQSYYAFATAAGCPPKWSYGNSSQTIFECLMSQNTSTLQEASAAVSTSGTFGSWAFLPVTDGDFIRSTPSEALAAGKINGLNHLSGNNAEEARFFVAPNITTENDLLSWIHLVFPLFTTNDTTQLLAHYPLSNLSAETPLFATNGESGLTALDVSQTARGQQQRAYTIYAETTFICPSYWLAESYSASTAGGAGYKYQFSVPNAVHGADLTLIFQVPTPNISPDFLRAFSQIWGNFVIHNNPSISSADANGAQSSENASSSALENWPRFTSEDRKMVNLNQTGGELLPMVVLDPYFLPTNLSTYQGEGLRNDLRVVDAETWEGGRGARCDFWKSVAKRVPE